MYPNEFNTVTYVQLPQKFLSSSLKQFLRILDDQRQKAKKVAVLEVKDGTTPSSATVLQGVSN